MCVQKINKLYKFLNLFFIASFRFAIILIARKRDKMGK